MATQTSAAGAEFTGKAMTLVASLSWKSSRQKLCNCEIGSRCIDNDDDGEMAVEVPGAPKIKSLHNQFHKSNPATDISCHLIV